MSGNDWVAPGLSRSARAAGVEPKRVARAGVRVRPTAVTKERIRCSFMGSPFPAGPPVVVGPGRPPARKRGGKGNRPGVPIGAEARATSVGRAGDVLLVSRKR